jgi:hypothetical protein
MNILTILLIVILILLLVGGLPTWGYHTYGWAPSGGVGLILLIIIIVLIVPGG